MRALGQVKVCGDGSPATKRSAWPSMSSHELGQALGHLDQPHLDA
jgi:hypothetical protein